MKSSPTHSRTLTPSHFLSRRDFLFQSGGGLGGIALAQMMASGATHHAAKAQRVVQLFMAGGASHVDLFDYKPELVKRHGQEANFGEPVEAFQNGLGPWLRPLWDFKAYGQSKRMLSDTVGPLGAVADELAFVHNMVGKTGVHSQGTLLQSTGFNRPGFPGMGCWVSYGLGSMNENLPTFVVLPDHRGLASNGTKNWDSAFLPAQHQGTVIFPGTKTPIEDLFADNRAKFITKAGDSAGHDLLAKLNRAHAAPREGDERLEARIKSYELAAKMQLAAPEALDISKETKETLKLYGLDHGQGTFDKEINPIEETGLLRPQVPRRPADAGARRAVCANLEWQ